MNKAPNQRRQSFAGGQCLVPELKMVGYDVFTKASASLAEHVHADAYEICYLLAGSVEWWAGDEVTEVGPGEVYVTRPGERHGGIDAFMHPCQLLWAQVIFPLPGLPPADNAALTDGLSKLAWRTYPAPPRVAGGIRTMLDEHAAPGPLSGIIVRAALHDMLVGVLRAHDAAKAGATGRHSPVIGQALRWMENHLTDDYAIDEVAAAVGLKPSRFHERFAAETGFAPAEHRTRQRIRRAKQLLRSPHSRSITEIAFMLGFSTSQYFATVFKNHVGLTPRAYRQRTRGS